MSMEKDAPWGEQSFERDRRWYACLPWNSWDDHKGKYSRHLRLAQEDPNYDLFDNFMPTGKPKFDIGRYVMRYGVKVPLVTSFSDWQACIVNGTAMLRSEDAQDYAGFSGLFSSTVIPTEHIYPHDQQGNEGIAYEWDSEISEITQTVEGPPQIKVDLSKIDMLRSDFPITRLGNLAIQNATRDLWAKGLYEGTVNPAQIMRFLFWDWQEKSMLEDAADKRYTPPYIKANWLDVSRWRFVPGINIRIFRDPVIEGKYFIRGHEAHHHWEVTDGVESPDVEAHTKSGYRYGESDRSFQYTLPTSEIITLYEKIRTLPYFDQRQAPVMEMQYGNDGELYFLQYFKTGLTIDDPGEFELPTSESHVTAYDVRGATSRDGEKVRIYMDPRVFTRSMEQQGVYVGLGLAHESKAVQVASMQSKVMVLDHNLCFKDNHFDSAPLYRPPVAIGLWDGIGEAEERLRTVLRQQPSADSYNPDDRVKYINAVVTSNGRKATIDSDWQLRTEQIN